MKENEILDMCQEECAELIQVISKVKRFGWDNHNPFNTPIKTNREHLIEELGDVLALIDVIKNEYSIPDNLLDNAKNNKIDKLKNWSTIFQKDDDGLVVNK
jgi:NTP pyrophosphatase (non-canonical NTP hydrolase)